MGKYYTAGITTGVSLQDIAARAGEAYANKETEAASAWYGSVDRMTSSYRNIAIFGEGVKRRYESGVREAATQRRFKFNPEKWKAKWVVAMSR